MSMYIRIKIYVICLLCTTTVLYAQLKELPKEISQSITPAGARMHVRFLASDALEGRATGERGLAVAGEYIASLFEKWQLKSLKSDDYRQPFYYLESRLAKDQKLEFVFTQGDTRTGIAGSYLSDFMVQYDQNQGISLDAPLVFAGFGITSPEHGWDDFKGLNLKNKVAVVLSEIPNIMTASGETIFGKRFGVYRNPLRKVEWAQQAGASAMIVIMDTVNFLQECSKWQKSFGRTKYTSPGNQNSHLPIIFISRELGEKLFETTPYSLQKARSLMETKKKTLHFNFPDVRTRLQINFDIKPHESFNIVGMREGTDPALKDEYIFVTAHYDHVGIKDGEICNGADDNASGTAGMLEIAEAFSRFYPDNKRSIVFAAFAGEELNLLGSRYFVDNLPVETGKVVACLNLDMIGRGKKGEENQLQIFGIDYSDDLKTYNEQCNQWFGFDIKYNGQFFLTSKSDQWPFIAKQIPGLFYFAGDHKDYHTPRDDYDKLNYDKLVKISRLAATVAYNLGQSDTRPAWHAKQ